MYGSPIVSANMADGSITASTTDSSAQSQASGGSTSWGDGNGGNTDITSGVEVDAPHTLVSNSTYLPADVANIFGCGGLQRSYQMGQFHSGPYRGVWLNLNLLGKAGNGRWVQSFINGLTGQFQADWDSRSGTAYPWYPTYASSGDHFFDDPAGQLGDSKTWVAQASYVLPSGTVAFTVMWGYQLSPNGNALHNQPVLAGPWAFQRQLTQGAK
jgi:hypothetical protein